MSGKDKLEQYCLPASLRVSPVAVVGLVSCLYALCVHFTGTTFTIYHIINLPGSELVFPEVLIYYHRHYGLGLAFTPAITPSRPQDTFHRRTRQKCESGRNGQNIEEGVRATEGLSRHHPERSVHCIYRATS
ncbi:hypothetical protein PG990_000673 [Apiospora arundinis]